MVKCRIETRKWNCENLLSNAAVRQNTNESLSVRIFQEGTRFAWTLNSPAKELLGRGTAETEKKARIDALEAGMTYMNHAKGRSSPIDISLN